MIKNRYLLYCPIEQEFEIELYLALAPDMYTIYDIVDLVQYDERRLLDYWTFHF